MNDARLVPRNDKAGAAPDAPFGRPDCLAEMSHEIRTPLNAMLGLLKLVQATELSAEQAEYLDLMKDAGDSLLSLVNDILDAARIEAGQLEIDNIPFSLRTCLGDLLRLLAPEARRKGLALTCDIDPEVPDALLGDPLRLRRILVNLVGNAIKFSERGDIAVRVVLQAGIGDELSCRFSVADDGIGIPAEQQAAIFTPFRQVDRSIARRYGGSGLGLSISARLVEMMNGKLWVDSAVGQGSTFHFTACFGRQAVPLPQTTALPAAVPTTFAAGTPLTILLVEDNPTNRRLAQIALEKAGHRVVPADSGTAAQALLATARPDLVLMDLQMPDMDGLQATAAIRREEAGTGAGRGRHLPIVALTAHALPEDRVRCLQAGMDDYLSKPVDPAVLLATIERLGHPVARPRPPARRCSVLDHRALFLQVQGDCRLLGEIRQLFVRDSHLLLARLRQAMARHDEALFGQTLHTLQGMFRSLSADAAREAARHLEHLGLQHARAGLAHARLEHEVKTLKAALLALGRDGKPAGAAARPNLRALRQARPAPAVGRSLAGHPTNEAPRTARRENSRRHAPGIAKGASR